MKGYKIQSMIRGFKYYLKIEGMPPKKTVYTFEGLKDNATELTREQATYFARVCPQHDETKIINA